MKQSEKIIAKMLKHPEIQWWYPQDFMQQDEFFVGYEASARLSEIASEFPDAIDSVKDGKYLTRRIKFEHKQLWLNDLKSKFSHIIEKYADSDICQICGSSPMTASCNNAECDV